MRDVIAFDESGLFTMFCSHNVDGLPSVAFEAGLMSSFSEEKTGLPNARLTLEAVSYTHLDVYKRQPKCRFK